MIDEKSNSNLFSKPEIVSPAGSEESFWAALDAGADAVYLGVKEFNARRRAENFDLKKLPFIIREAHLRNRKVYVALNILIKNSELKDALSVAETVLEAGADALILQDLGFAFALKKLFENVRLHASTQVNAHNVPTVQFLTKSGFKRVVFARELSLSEIKRIIGETGVEAEVFVHGALCYSYSGQCLMSSVVGGRSGNRGLCAQPCRLPYQFEISPSRGKPREIVETPHPYILSTKDLFSLYLLPDLLEAGVKALKIEGRLKSPEYVYLVTSVYSEELKRAVEFGKKYEPREESLYLLEEAFSRGFSEAYLSQKRGNTMMSYTRPNNRGVFVGRVVYVDAIGGKVGVNLRKDLNKGDVVEFWTTKKGKVTQKIEALFDDEGERESVSAGKRAHFVVENNRHLISPGDRVYRVLNASLLKKLRGSLRSISGGSVPINLYVEITPDGTASLTVKTMDAEVKFKDKVEVEVAKKAPTTAEIFKNQLSKLGGTPYYAENIEVSIPDQVHIKLKEINKLRRKAVEHINEERLKIFTPQIRKKSSAEELLKNFVKTKKRIKTTPGFAVKVGDREILDLALEAKPDVIFIRYPFFRKSGFNGIKDVFRLYEQVSSLGIEFGLSIPAAIKDDELESLEEALSDLRHMLILSDNLGLAVSLSDKKFKVYLDYHLNFFNSLYEQAFSKTSVRGATISSELNLEEIKEISASTNIPLSVLVGGDIELMTAEHCSLTALANSSEFVNRFQDFDKSCVLLAKEGSRMPRFCEIGNFYLKDKLGYEFPVRSDTSCRSYIYNSRILCALSFIPELYDAGISLFRVDLLSHLISAEDARKLLFSLRKIIDELKAGKKPEVSEEALCPENFTRGHFKRGVL